MFVLADRLHKSVAEIRGLSADEIVHWAAYLEIERREITKARA
jgi:uncharacterized membrane protein